MISVKKKLLGLEVAVPNVPETLAEAVAAYGESVVLAGFVNPVIYNVWNPDVRAAALEAIEASTGIARKTRSTGKEKEVKNEATGEVTKEPVLVYDETEKEYFDRLVGSGEPEQFQSFFDTAAAATEFNGAARERAASGPKAIAKMYLNGAQQIIDAGKGEVAAAKLSDITGVTITSDLESLAKGLKIKADKERAALVGDLIA